MDITWSLAVEEQFYLLLPLVIRNFSVKSLLRLTIATILLAPVLRTALWFYSGSSFGAYTLLPCRADALGFGVLLALACRNDTAWTWFVSHRRHLYAALAVLGLGLAAMTLRATEHQIGTLGYSWIAAFYATLLLLVLANQGKIERQVFSTPVLVRLGTLAYAVYLFHQGTNGLFHWALLAETPWIHDLSSLGITVFSLIIVVALAEVSWRYMEKPLIQRAQSRYRYAMPYQKPFVLST